jgi:hypothetical protein
MKFEIKPSAVSGRLFDVFVDDTFALSLGDMGEAYLPDGTPLFCGEGFSHDLNTTGRFWDTADVRRPNDYEVEIWKDGHKRFWCMCVENFETGHYKWSFHKDRAKDALVAPVDAES